jgi:hypothetical protein
MTHADIIMAKGGPVEFAKAVGASVDEVRVWRARNRLPQTRWLQIHEAYPDLDWGTLTASPSGRPVAQGLVAQS